MLKDIKTPKELYEYCVENNAEDYKIKIFPQEKIEKPKGKGIWVVPERKEVLIII